MRGTTRWVIGVHKHADEEICPREPATEFHGSAIRECTDERERPSRGRHLEWLAVALPRRQRTCPGKVIAMQSSGWPIMIEFDEDDRHTHATATARVREDRRMTARGDAHRNPSDSNQPLVGEEIAAARALIDLGTQLLQAAAAQIEQVTNPPAHLVR
jgi:hypothetical protein